MKTVVVVDNPGSWFMPHARRLVGHLSRGGESRLVASADAIATGTNVAFLLSCERIVPAAVLARSENNVVVHASALPDGRGMSPLAWQILEGKGTIPLSLFEAIDRVDAGPIYLSDQVEFDGTELLPDMQSALGRKMVDMCVRFAANRETLRAGARPQSGTPSYYPWRTPADSQLDPHHTIAEQFDLLRIVDNRRYPAYFDFRGRRYVLSITHAKDTK